MSCGQPSQDEAQSENIPILPPPSSTCVRCGQPPKIVVRATAWCHDCFLASFQGRFRRSLEGAKVVSRNGFATYEGAQEERVKGKSKGPEKPLSNVLLAFSGGSSSRAMLELFKTFYFKQAEPAPQESAPEAADTSNEEATVKKQKKPKKQFFPPAFSQCQVVYIDESELPGFGSDKTAEMKRIVEETTPFEFLPLKLSSIFSTSDAPTLSTCITLPELPAHPSTSTSSASTPRDKLLALLHPSPPLPPTTYSTLRQTLLHSLLLSTARSRGCEVLLLGDNSTRLGIKTISSMSQGRGWSVGEEISIEYVDRQEAFCDLMVCRPMGASLGKEVAYYVESEALETVLVTNEDTSLTRSSPSVAVGDRDIKKVGIGKLVEDFVLNLEAQFPSTVSIITKTAHKLGMRSADTTLRDTTCALCQMPAQVSAEGWRRAITIADLQSARQALANPNPTALEASIPIKTTSAIKKREPYQPSKNHLLPESSATETAVPVVEPTSVPSESKQEDGQSHVLSLSSHLCYACLLLLQTARPPTSKLSTTSTDGGYVDLPPYVGENIAKTAAVRGEEGLRRQIEGYLLD
ncbi:Ncs2p [Sporobolomyces koalae]|uniref:Ncs2p n=1 Tax=Sporobolomyces koalae TaxID=500713 RepID=UPI00316DCD92